MKGVRGFNDRAHPKLSNGKSIWHQPIESRKVTDAFCGCAPCDFKWKELRGELKDLFYNMSCQNFVNAMDGSTPSVKVEEGMSCKDMINGLVGTSFQHMKVSDELSTSSTCDAQYNVNITSSKMLQDGHDDKYQLPYPLHFENTSATCMSAPSMGYDWDIGMWNGGKMDAWDTARNAGFGMAYFNRTDLPFYHALADAFTIGDQYFQSTFTATNPNRLHQFTGSNGLSVDSPIKHGTGILDDDEPAGVNWTTLGELLEEKNISWKVYQEQDNFGDNAFEWFDQYRAAKPGEPLYEKAMKRSDNVTEDFKLDINSGNLPQVSIVIAPAWLSEHATNHP